MIVIIDVLEKIFNILLPFSLLAIIFEEYKQNISKNTKKTEVVVTEDIRSSWKSNVETFMSILITIFLIFGAIYLCIECKMSWILTFFAFPLYIQQVIEAYLSVGVVRDVISASQIEKLSLREKKAIGAIAYIVCLCGVFNIFEKILNTVGKIENPIIWDFAMTLSYVFLEFLYIFFIFTFFPNILFVVFNILKKMSRFFPLTKKFKKCEYYFIEKCDKGIKINFFVIKSIDKILERGLINRLIGIIFLPISFCIDIILSSFLILITMVRSLIGYLFLLFRLFIQTMKKIAKWISQLSDRRIVAMSFRIAIILALVITVITNRYQPFLQKNVESTSVLEFVASSIIIPVIFEWIYSIRQHRNSCI
ncbi:hypothetical protein B5F14_10015 [Faecalitalea cylindroides]|uniref:Uncharacterized protein n=1 Tax=Faecalitalea cylindroides TaxID=39483 RepID=A0A1Y4LNZ9_9FIRM|nr:hypothetical protein [Faecalitalea cylindroides]OUP55922.1 hypothetical protein B5F14_10015 [Faecalitalea cylindroides]